MKRLLLISLLAGCSLLGYSCQKGDDNAAGGGNTPPPVVEDGSADIAGARTNLQRAISVIEAARAAYFSSSGLAMSRYYNPLTGRKSSELGSVWMYTSAIEAVNASLHAMQDLKDAGYESLYSKYYDDYKAFLSELFENLKYYEGTFTLTSYTQTKEWTVYGVNRSWNPGNAKVEGRENVYDDQQWLVRELIESYRITGENKYLEKAEYLAGYVLDGWDTTLDENGVEHGGIVWGPGYYTKHSCSNGPFISPLVWLSDIYKESDAQIEYRYIDKDNSRRSRMMNKSEYYLMYAGKVYDFQRNHLFRKSDGVYWDMLGAEGFNGDNIAYETVGGKEYRAHNKEQGPVGEAYSYNSGTMLSGAADLYGATGEQKYFDDMKSLSSNAFRYFAKKSGKYPDLYEYAVDGFNNWFNGVLMRGWVDMSPYYSNVSVQVNSFQKNLDHAYSNYLKDGILPPNLVYGWNPDESKNNVEAMFTFAFAAEYAVLAKYYLNK